MHFYSLTVLPIFVKLAVAGPFEFPLANGFPQPNQTALQQITKLAGGTPPNGPLPTNLTDAATQTLQLIALNELFEVAYFAQLLDNVTSEEPGFEVEDKTLIVQTLRAVENQEQLHALAANAVLSSASKQTIEPCQYDFPVTTFDEAILLAQTFTDVVLGVLPLAQTTFAQDGGNETNLIAIIGSIIGQEGEQNGFYRYLQKKVASSAPFLTGGAPQFAFTAVSQFIVPGSCPSVDQIGLTAFQSLTVESAPMAQNSTQIFSANGTFPTNDSSMAYISGQNLPVSVPISSSEVVDGKTYFFAPFPFDSGFARGLTIGAVVSGPPRQFNSSAEVANATLYGPALIEVD